MRVVSFPQAKSYPCSQHLKPLETADGVLSRMQGLKDLRNPGSITSTSEGHGFIGLEDFGGSVHSLGVFTYYVVLNSSLRCIPSPFGRKCTGVL